mmetsp:Transcript_1804/g.3912  ORF Transcript_1804/g.3912 Transcript_1804/m.3912 type:complete len:708 (+) Transcript_1804:108-2231(+)
MEKRGSLRRKSGVLANPSYAGHTFSSSCRQITFESNNPSMTTAEFLRIHSNASPAKLRDIVNNKIFVADDVEYLKMLVNDIGMEYVFRFLWYDGCPSASLSSRWKDSSSAAAKQESVGEKGPSTRESSASSISGGSSPFSKYQESIIRRGRTWVEYCCFYNAHKCLLWIFREIILHYRQQKKQLQLLGSKQESENSDSDDEYLAEANKVDEEDILPDVEIIRQLLESPSASYCGTNYVAVATLQNSYQCLSLLLHHGGINPNTEINSHGATAAHLSCWKDNVECLRVLSLDYHIDVTVTSLGNKKVCDTIWNHTNAQGETPMHIAAKSGSADSMQFFLDLLVASENSGMTRSQRGCDVSLRSSGLSDTSGLTESSNTSKCEGDDQSERTIVDFGVRNNDGMDCTALAAMHNQAKIITLLSQVIQQLENMKRSSRLEGQQESSSLKLAPQSQLSVSTTSQKSMHPYVLPQSPSRIERRRRRPNFYPTLNQRNSLERHNHEMPIHLAARHGHRDVIEALFASGCCDVTARDSFGMTALHVAILTEHFEVCKFFVGLTTQKFQEFDVVDLLGRTPLYIACSLGNTEMVRILAPISNWKIVCHERRKAVDGPLYVNVAHQPPLHAAIVKDHVNTVSALLECGVDVNQKDAEGHSAISVAAKLGYYEMCQMLIMHGANVNSRSHRQGPTPYQKAKKYKHQHVAELLYEFGGR